MSGRWPVTAKAMCCLAVAAAGDWLSSAVAIYLLMRVLGAYWGGDEAKIVYPGAGWLYRAGRWLWRFEVAVALGYMMAGTVISAVIGAGRAGVLAAALVVVSLAVPPSNEALRRRLIDVRRSRRWQACLIAAMPAGKAPTVAASGSSPAGEWAEVRVAAGTTVTELSARTEAIAAFLGVQLVRVDRHATNAGRALIQALATDPLAAPAPPWPWLHLARSDAWWPIPVGVDEAGRPVMVTLAEHNLLLGGEPGAGKSVALSQLVAAVALDPAAGLWLADGKLVELAGWASVADGWAGTDMTDAVNLLRAVQAIMDSRYRQLLEEGRRKIVYPAGLQVVVIDELAHYLTHPEKKQRDAFADILRDLVSRGRAAGIVVIAATQKPSSDVVPTSLRDLFGYRWALRCTTNAASDTILGSGWAAEGVSSSTIAPQHRGVGWLLHESGTPIRVRAHHLDDVTVYTLAQRAKAVRAGAKIGRADDDGPDT